MRVETISAESSPVAVLKQEDLTICQKVQSPLFWDKAITCIVQIALDNTGMACYNAVQSALRI